MTNTDYTEDDRFWHSLPASQKMALRRSLWKYLRSKGIPSYQDLCDVLFWQALENEVLDAVAAWLAQAKAEVEAQGQEWTTTEMARYGAAHPERD